MTGNSLRRACALTLAICFAGGAALARRWRDVLRASIDRGGQVE